MRFSHNWTSHGSVATQMRWGDRVYTSCNNKVIFRCNIRWTDNVEKSLTRSDFPPHLLATINSPNLRPRASANNAARLASALSSLPSSPTVTGSASVPSSPATRKSSSSSMLGRLRAKIRDADRRADAIVVDEPETLDADAYASNSLPNSPGSRKRQTAADAPPVGVRQQRALPRLTSSAKTTQTGSSLPRADSARTAVCSENSTSGIKAADSPRIRLARPTALTMAAATAAANASIQRRKLPTPPRDDDDDGDDDDDDDDRLHSSRRADFGGVGTVTSLCSQNATSAAATSRHVTFGRCRGTLRPRHYAVVTTTIQLRFDGHSTVTVT